MHRETIETAQTNAIRHEPVTGADLVAVGVDLRSLRREADAAFRRSSFTAPACRLDADSDEGAF